MPKFLVQARGLHGKRKGKMLRATIQAPNQNAAINAFMSRFGGGTSYPVANRSRK